MTIFLVTWISGYGAGDVFVLAAFRARADAEAFAAAHDDAEHTEINEVELR